MNSPGPEPQGGLPQTKTSVKLVFLDRAGKPIVGEVIEHIPLRLRTEKDGGVVLPHLNGSPVKFGPEGINVKHLVQTGVVNILKRDSWRSHFNKA